MNNRDLISVYVSLQKVKTQSEQDGGSLKFKYDLIKALKVLEPEIEPFRDIEKESSAMIAPYKERRVELAKKYGTETENSGEYFVDDKNPEVWGPFNKEVRELEEELKDQIEAFSKKDAEYGALLEEKIEKNPEFKFTVDSLPDWLSTSTLELLDKNGFLKE
jgi:hypothetical protein